MDVKPIEGRVAVVTGGGSGIGAAVARRFLAAGARVAVVDRELAAVPDGALPVPGDVGDEADVAAGHGLIRERLGRPELLVTCAGVSNGRSLQDCGVADWEAVFRVNVTGTFLWMRAVLGDMEAGDAIVTVSSQLAIAGGRGNAAYIASKGAILSLTRSVAVEVAPRGIRVNALAPGAVETPMLARSFARAADTAAARARSVARHAMGRLGRPEEVADAALFLAGASFVTGVVLPVDGGWTAA